MTKLANEMTIVEAARALRLPAGRQARITVRELWNACSKAANEKNLELKLEIEDIFSTSDVIGDKQRIRQVLINLVGNAVKFTPTHGKVSVTVERNGDEWVQTSVADTGPGIPLEEANKIFDKFYQIAQAGKQKARGTGLGLAISKALVEMHGGRIWVESEVGRGSTFFFTLPAQQPFRL